jgi:hypothetical protein
MPAFTAPPAGERRKSMPWRAPALIAVLGLLVAGTATASAAAPVPTTGAATDITPVGATLNGAVDPRGAATSAYFQYGLTTKYGNRTPAQDAGLNPGTVPISASVTGLKSSRTYHVRVVAENKDGKKFGSDRTFKTAAPTTIPVFTPNPAPYGSAVTVTGTLVGSGANGATTRLYGRPFPYTSDYTLFGNPVVADSNGNYVFALTHVLSTAQFQVQADTKPAFTSQTEMLSVSSLISLHTPKKVKRGHRATFWGIVAPAQDHTTVDIEKLQANGKFTHFTTTSLRHRKDGRSGYSTKKKVWKSATYRAIVRSNGGALQEGTTPNSHTIHVTRR